MGERKLIPALLRHCGDLNHLEQNKPEAGVLFRAAACGVIRSGPGDFDAATTRGNAGKRTFVFALLPSSDISFCLESCLSCLVLYLLLGRAAGNQRPQSGTRSEGGGGGVGYCMQICRKHKTTTHYLLTSSLSDNYSSSRCGGGDGSTRSSSSTTHSGGSGISLHTGE